MADFNCIVRIPTSAEYDQLMDVAAEDNAVVFWKGMYSWVDGPKPVAEFPNLRAFRGFTSARYYCYYSADCQFEEVGFRPTFEFPSDDALSADAADGDVVVIGTLYMDGKPVRAPQNPMYNGDVENYVPGAKLEFGSALDNPAYQVRAIKCGDVFICDRCLLKNISYNDICASFPNVN